MNLTKLRAWRLAFSGPILFSYFSLFYLLLLHPGSRSPFSILMLLAALLIAFANGFLINDLSDRKYDQAAGVISEQRGHHLTTGNLFLLAIVTWTLGALTILLSGGDYVYYALWALGYFLSACYSFPPLALKRRGVAGAIGDSLVERPIPILIVFSFFQYYGVETVLFPILSELSWSVLKHQVADYYLDKRANVGTFAVSMGRERSFWLVTYVLNPASVAAQFLLLLVASIRIPLIRPALVLVSSLMVVGIVGAILFGSRIPFRATPTDPPYIMFTNFSYRLLILPTLAFYALSVQPQLFLVGAIFVISLIPHLRDYGVNFPRTVRSIRVKS